MSQEAAKWKGLKIKEEQGLLVEGDPTMERMGGKRYGKQVKPLSSSRGKALFLELEGKGTSAYR